MIPSIHLNGTSQKELLELNCDAANQVSDAISRLSRATPHGRDYYVQGSDAWTKAMREHECRIDKLREVYTELQSLCVAIDDGGFKR